jgi:hypothetical protein
MSTHKKLERRAATRIEVIKRYYFISARAFLMI